jgi:hypothetical protein
MEGSLTLHAGMSDPNFKAEEAAPPKPPRPQPRNQVDQDEMYARQLAEHFQSQGGQQGQGGYGSERRSSPYARSNNQSQNKDDREYSFFDGELVGNTLKTLSTNTCRRPSRDPQEHRTRLPRDTEDSQQVDHQLQEEARRRAGRLRSVWEPRAARAWTVVAGTPELRPFAIGPDVRHSQVS